MKKRVCALLLVLALALSLLPAAALAAGPTVAKIGSAEYDSIQAAVDAAQDGDTITVEASHALDCSNAVPFDGYKTLIMVENKTVTIDLNGKQITCDVNISGVEFSMVITTKGTGNLTLIDSKGGGSVVVTATTEVYGLLVNYNDTASITVEGGSYRLDKAYNKGASTGALVYSTGNERVTVHDGNFYLGNIGIGENGSPWIFNANGQNERHVIVTGGTFNADVNHQYYPFEVDVPKEKALKNNGDGTWTIVPAVAYVTEWEWSSAWYNHEVGYATVEEAEAALLRNQQKVAERLDRNPGTMPPVEETILVPLAPPTPPAPPVPLIPQINVPPHRLPEYIEAEEVAEDAPDVAESTPDEDLPEVDEEPVVDDAVTEDVEIPATGDPAAAAALLVAAALAVLALAARKLRG